MWKMFRRKELISTLLAILSVLLLCACGSDTASDTESEIGKLVDGYYKNHTPFPKSMISTAE